MNLTEASIRNAASVLRLLAQEQPPTVDGERHGQLIGMSLWLDAIAEGADEPEPTTIPIPEDALTDDAFEMLVRNFQRGEDDE